jgi:vanillate O-demethylase ferredoxin subunit
MVGRNQSVHTIVERIDETLPGIKRFVLVDPEGWKLPPFRPGAHIDLHLPNGLIRTYSLCNSPDDDARYVVAVKREDLGRGGSIALHDEVRVGDPIPVSLPRAGYTSDLSTDRHIMIAGGIGVTPFLSIASALAVKGRTDFVLHVVARGTPPMLDLIEPLASIGTVHLHDTAAAGRPDLADLLGEPDQNVRLFCCGPESLLAAFEAATAEWPRDRVHIERFVPLPIKPDPTARPFELVLARSGKSRIVEIGETLIDAAADMGITIPVSCGGGICGACRVSWLDGEPIHRDRVLSSEDRKRHLMACVAGCSSERLVLNL